MGRGLGSRGSFRFSALFVGLIGFGLYFRHVKLGM